MVRVTIKSEKYDSIEFEFAEFEVASDFMNLALNAAVGAVKIEIENVTEEGRSEEPESRFPEPEEVPAEELASVEGFF